ncbi:hypothetical protein ACFOOM_31785 [Streptomyces echinoruber]|uniref:Uncharacterized protein n=1 Tax=Streptomyces echinoruber TaxID=68898 RepID=A0A918RS28_9ACTN|nr:hypothetical protein [Streptomyces echinoruber]GHA10202.1 hypothetical protein GCM10010389_56770 [Streptomyces echinoruber]
MNTDGFEKPRLLPWVGPDGKPAYVIAEPERPGPVSRLADAVEAAQMDMAETLLGHARQLVGELGPGELRYLAAQLTHALTDILRIARRVRS